MNTLNNKKKNNIFQMNTLYYTKNNKILCIIRKIIIFFR